MKCLGSTVAVLLAFTTGAQAAELKLVTVRATTTILWQIGEEFERSTGHKLSVTTGFNRSFTKRIREGETFDLVFAPASCATHRVLPSHVLVGHADVPRDQTRG